MKKKQWVIARTTRGRTRIVNIVEGGSQEVVMYLRDNNIGDLRDISVFPQTMFLRQYKQGKKGWWSLIKLIKKNHDTKRKSVKGIKAGGGERLA